MTKNIKIGLIGSTGKLGQAILQANESKNINIITCTKLDSFEEKCPQADVWIDASLNELASTHIQICNQYNKPILICTTGTYTANKYKEEIEANNKGNQLKSPVMFAANTSLAFAYIKKLLFSLKTWNTHIIDTHHFTKKDKPAGTTKEIMNFMNVESFFSVRNNINGAKMQFLLDNFDESIEITYNTYNRLPYAKGALLLSVWLEEESRKSCHKDVYFMDDYINNISM